jgi:hemolysin activation/secretion protein
MCTAIGLAAPSMALTGAIAVEAAATPAASTASAASATPSIRVRWDELQVRRGLPAIPPVDGVIVSLFTDGARVLAPAEAPATAVPLNVPVLAPPVELPPDWSPAAADRVATAVTRALEDAGWIATTTAERPAAGGLDLRVQVELGPFVVSGVELVAVAPHPGRPAPADLLDLPITLGRVDAGLAAPAAGRPSVTVPLRAIGTLMESAPDALPGDPLYGGALRAIVIAVRDALVAADLLGVSVAVDPGQITTDDLRDRRPLADRSLRILYTTGVVKEVRSLDTAAADRATGLNLARHAVVRDASPLQPWTAEDAAADRPRRDLLRRDRLEDHLARLERLPGRRVDAAIAAADGDQGGAALEYLVREREPLLWLVDVANTGTEQTDEWRTRFRLDAYRPTDRDDLFALEYITAGFDASHLLTAVYDTPLRPASDPLGPRLRLSAGASRYTASDVGFAGAGFEGESWNIDAELVWNIHQHGELFVDAFVGVRWDSISVDNRVARIDGSTALLRPRIGLRMERDTLTGRTDGFFLVETNLGDLAGTRDDDLNRLGRLFTEPDFTVLRYGLSHSGWLEPLLDRAAWEDLTSPESSTLAHELRLGVRGQLAFGRRLLPQAQQVAGGLYSVRGHPESIVAGDDVVIASAEYRFHVPRSMPYRPAPDTLFGRPFRLVPTEPYGGADWDLVLKAFVDAARASVNDPLFFESGATLVGAGVGVEFAWKRTFRLQLDYGVALRDVRGRGVDAGDDRLHVAVSLVF